MHGFLIKLITQTPQGSTLHRHVQIWRTCCCRRMRKNAFVRLPINAGVHQLERVTVRCLTQLLKYYFNHKMFFYARSNDISKSTAPCQFVQENTSVLCKINRRVLICKYHGHKEKLCVLLQVQLLACGRY